MKYAAVIIAGLIAQPTTTAPTPKSVEPVSVKITNFPPPPPPATVTVSERQRVVWSLADLHELPGPSGTGNIITIPIDEIVSIEPGGGTWAGATYIVRGAPNSVAIVVAGDYTVWRQRFITDGGFLHRDYTTGN